MKPKNFLLLLLVINIVFFTNCLSSSQKNNPETINLSKVLEYAEQGAAEAQYKIGYNYYYGEGLAQDYQKTTEWYNKATAQGHAVAQATLGAMYYDGIAVAQNYKKAVEWCSKVAAQGNATAQYNRTGCKSIADHNQN